MDKIRDLRDKYFQVDDEYLNGYARLCGPYATLVYFSLCRHANKEQQCFPSKERIAESLAISERTVYAALKTLEQWKIITITDQGRKEDGSYKPLVYTLLDKSEWKPKPPSASPAVGMKQQEPSANDDINRRHVVPNKETHLNQTHLNQGEHTPRAAALAFFSDPESQTPVLATLTAKGIPEDLARRELKKFILYWTEPNATGTRERWQLEKVFDVSRRLATWFSNVNKFERSRSQPKGITI